jgi:hypothetical protein
MVRQVQQLVPVEELIQFNHDMSDNSEGEEQTLNLTPNGIQRAR